MDATDRAILVALLDGETTCQAIANHLGVARSTVNRHMPALDRAGLVRSRWEPHASRIGALVYRLTGKGRALAEGLRQASLGLACAGHGYGGETVDDACDEATDGGPDRDRASTGG